MTASGLGVCGNSDSSEARGDLGRQSLQATDVCATVVGQSGYSDAVSCIWARLPAFRPRGRHALDTGASRGLNGIDPAPPSAPAFGRANEQPILDQVTQPVERVPHGGLATSIGNRLLAALPPADLGLLTPHFQKVSFKPDAVLVQSGDELDQIYFPHSGAICLHDRYARRANGRDHVDGAGRRIDLALHARPLAFVRHRDCARGRHRIADFRREIPAGLCAKRSHQACRASPRPLAVTAAPARGRLQRAASGGGPHGASPK